MEFDGSLIPYINTSLISVAKRCGTYCDRNDAFEYSSYQLVKYRNHNSFVRIFNEMSLLTEAIDKGGAKFTISNYQKLFVEVCQIIASSTNIDKQGIGEMVIADALTTHQAHLVREAYEKRNRDQRKEFLSKLDKKMSELVKELRITISKSYVPIAIIIGLVALGHISWFGTRYWIKEKSAQAQLPSVMSQNQALTVENKELAKYKSVKKEIQDLRDQVEILKDENNQIKADNDNLKKDRTYATGTSNGARSAPSA